MVAGRVVMGCVVGSDADEVTDNVGVKLVGAVVDEIAVMVLIIVVVLFETSSRLTRIAWI